MKQRFSFINERHLLTERVLLYFDTKPSEQYQHSVFFDFNPRKHCGELNEKTRWQTRQETHIKEIHKYIQLLKKLTDHSKF